METIILTEKMSAEEKAKKIQRSIVKKFRKQIWCKFTKAIREYDLIQDGDRIAVCTNTAGKIWIVSATPMLNTVINAANIKSADKKITIFDKINRLFFKGRTA